MKLTKFLAAIAVCLSTAIAPTHVSAQSTTQSTGRPLHPGDIEINDPWSRPLPPVSTNGAAYLTLVNHAMNADRLIAGSSPIAERVEFHKHVHSGSVMKMQRIEVVDIGAHDAVTMAPGGMHVMLLGLKKPLSAGDSFPLTLTFDKAGTTTVTVKVEARSTTLKAPTMKHGKHKKH